MSSVYHLLERDGFQLDSITNDKAGLRFEVCRHGAELVSLSRRGPGGDWVPFLYRDGQLDAPADGWKNHATVMGFFTHRILGERTTYRGREIRGGTHSFLRTKDFGAPAVETGALTYSIGPGQYEALDYPFPVQLNLTYAVACGPDGGDPELLVTFDFQNHERELPAHVSFGLHPGFAVGSLAGARVLMPAGVYVRHLSPGNFLSGETVRIEHAGGPMPFPRDQLAGSFLLELAETPEPVFTIDDPAGHRRVRLDVREAPYVTIWSDGHDFICIEPCWGLPDSHEQRPFEEKEGIQEIPPGGKLTRSFSVKVETTA